MGKVQSGRLGEWELFTGEALTTETFEMLADYCKTIQAAQYPIRRIRGRVS